MRCALSGLE
uniref:Uncharacterized protein n=1 Tax=Anguilla anguilla TaxID=7936 RepID=A0A0E9VQR6_ANGAN